MKLNNDFPFKKGDKFQIITNVIIFKKGGIVYLCDDKLSISAEHDQIKEESLDYYIKSKAANEDIFKIVSGWYLPVCKYCHKSDCPAFDLESRTEG